MTIFVRQQMMRMNFINPTSAEQNQWDELVKKNNGTVFSESRYLNALDLDWMILYNENRTGGMACPYAKKAGQHILVNPIYHQYTEWIGEGSVDEKVIGKLRSTFKIAELNMRQIVPNSIERVHQVIISNDFKLNDLAKRSLKKSLIYQFSLNKEISLIKDLISSELTNRIAGMTSENLHNLEKVALAFQSDGLRSYCAYENGQLVGGIWVIENETECMYLKGTATPEAKKNGAMYGLMKNAIDDCIALNKRFDFGGSNAPTVQRFNYNLGGKDDFYSQLKWNDAPFWWNALRKIKKLMKV